MKKTRLTNDSLNIAFSVCNMDESKIAAYKLACDGLGVRFTRKDAERVAQLLLTPPAPPPPPSKDFAVYTLLLKNGVYYVGRSTRQEVDYRIEQHRIGHVKSAVYVKKHGFDKVVEIEYCDSPHQELIKFLQLVETHGAELVRGSIYCREKHGQKDLDEITRILRGSADKCYRCGSDQHFVAHCPAPRTGTTTTTNRIRIRNSPIVNTPISESEMSDETESNYSDYIENAWEESDDEWVPAPARTRQRTH